jgi:hypothetical protein
MPPAIAAMPPTMTSEPADPDALALHPEPGAPVANLPEFTGYSNIPSIPDENDATLADETNAQQDDAGELAQE